VDQPGPVAQDADIGQREQPQIDRGRRRHDRNVGAQREVGAFGASAAPTISPRGVW
jgi:hypothetical protein